MQTLQQSKSDDQLLKQASSSIVVKSYLQADEALSKLLETSLNPKNLLSALVIRASLRFSKFRDFDGAYRDYTDAFALATSGKASRSLLLSIKIFRSTCLLKLGDYKSATADCNAAVKLANGTKSSALFCLQADLAHLAGENRKAVATYDQAIAIDKQYVPAYIGQAYSLRDMGDFTAAKLSWSKAHDLDRTLPGALPSAADTRAQDVKDLLEGRKLALSRSSGKRIQSSGQEHAAIEVAVSKGTATANDYLKRAKFQISKHADEAAMFDLDDAIKRDPNLVEGYRLRGYLSYRAGKFDKAYRDYGRVIRSAPNELASVLAHGLSAEKIGKADEAFVDFGKATAISPELNDGWLGKTRILYSKGNYLAALENVNRAIPLSEDDPNGYYYRALIQLKMMRKDAAKTDLDHALKLNPNSKEIQAAIAGIEK